MILHCPAISDLTILVESYEGHLSCRKTVVGCCRGCQSVVQTWTWPSWCHWHWLPLASAKFRLALPG